MVEKAQKRMQKYKQKLCAHGFKTELRLQEVLATLCFNFELFILQKDISYICGHL